MTTDPSGSLGIKMLKVSSGRNPPKSAASPKLLKVVAQQPGPDGSRVVRKRASIPRLGAGFGDILTHLDVLTSASKNVSGTSKRNSDGTTSTAKAATEKSTHAPKNSGQKLSIDKEVEELDLSDSPLTPTDEDASFDSAINPSADYSFSTPNSTPPLPKGQDDGQYNSVLVTPVPKSLLQPMPHLADKLINVRPDLTGPERKRHKSPVSSDPATPPNDFNTTKILPGYPFPQPASAQSSQPIGSTQADEICYCVRDLMKEFGTGAMQWPTPAERQPAAHWNACSPTFVPNYRPIEESHVNFVPISTYPTFSPGLVYLTPIQYHQPFKVLSREQKLALLEFKLNRHILEDGNRANGSIAVHIFVDMSNIWIGFINAMKAALGMPQSSYLKSPISFEILARILERGRNVQKRVLAGSLAFPASRRENWPFHLREAENMNYDMNIFDRVQIEPRIHKRSGRQGRGSNDTTSSDESMDNTTMKLGKKHGEQGVGKYLLGADAAASCAYPHIARL